MSALPKGNDMLDGISKLRVADAVDQKADVVGTPTHASAPNVDASESKDAETSIPEKRQVVLRHEIVELEASDDEESGEQAVDDEHAQGFLSGYPDDTDELNINQSRIQSCAPLNLPRFAKSLKKLCLRQNFITTVDEADFGPLVNLEELDLYDNKIKNLGDALKDHAHLRSLDLSFNLLRHVPEVISTLSAIHTLYFVQNKFTKITNLHNIGATLRSLELGGNRIRVIENLDALVNLEELWLGKNKISKLENLDALSKLQILSVQSNRLVKIEGLDKLVNLRELYLSHNGIERLEGLDSNLTLETIDAGNNRIPALENLSHLKSLEELWMNDNNIPNLHDLDSQLASTSTLKTIYLEGNPCQRNDMGGYRRKIILALPQVVQIDATYVKTA
ncbi:hypothetical protein FRB94_009238 [Tulasnella sp. JGI-2019a]|nr:hypothetical protein FRB94_009238 [Tulasnella sp. JGI-2019a]KAG9016495.1 hypothetical protein FRB93_010744 [Tulasnella sp. JGI-2019a]KAG9030562.1 hypothetical protein FRB95_003823 [Tulasnella sp. JGI-2019a]